MKGKICYFDTETTGLSTVDSGIIQAAFIIEEDGIILDEKVWYINPNSSLKWSTKAQEVHGFTQDQVKDFTPEIKAQKEIVNWFSSFVNKFDTDDKFYPSAYNGIFDVNFLVALWERVGDDYFGSFFNWKLLDPRYFANWLIIKGIIDVPNVKQETLRDYFNIKVVGDAHDALVDVRICRKLVHLFFNTYL